MKRLSVSKKTLLVGFMLLCSTQVFGSGGKMTSIHKTIKSPKKWFFRRMLGDKIFDYGPKILLFGSMGAVSGVINVPIIPRKTMDKLFKTSVLTVVGYYLFWGSGTVNDTNKRVRRLQKGQTELKGGQKEQSDALHEVFNAVSNNYQEIIEVKSISTEVKGLTSEIDRKVDLNGGGISTNGEKIDHLTHITETSFQNLGCGQKEIKEGQRKIELNIVEKVESKQEKILEQNQEIMNKTSRFMSFFKSVFFRRHVRSNNNGSDCGQSENTVSKLSEFIPELKII